MTPRFAEEYSVFNSTPGNLRGSQGPFADFVPPPSYSRGHKRLLSADGPPSFGAPPHASHHLSASDREKIDPPCHLPLSPPGHQPPSVSAGLQLSPDLARSTSLKKCRNQSDDARPTQILSPPPSSNKQGRKLAPRLTMLTDHAFCHSDLMDPAHHDMSGLMGHSGDLFGYPLSAPASASPNYWDPSMSMPMDLEFNAAVHGVMQPSSHRHTGSFDWNADITMFQDVSGPLTSASQENAQPPRQDRAIAPKQSGPEAAANPVSLEDPFGIMNPGDSVDPGLLMGRPHTSAMDSAFGSLAPAHPRPVDGAASLGRPMAGELRRANSAQGPRSAALADRASVGSPVKSSAARPGLGRSCSENRGRRARGRGMMKPAPLPSSGLDASLGHGVVGRRPAGRCTPPKTVPRVTSLASIPEASPQYRRPRTSVRFTIDSRGRARAETTVVGEGLVSDERRRRSRSAAWDSSDDDESTDDEPIIIPSRNSSFNASYALPDPCKPVGSIFHTSCRSLSDRSRSNSAESEAETVINDKGGDALRELRKVVEDRQRRSRRMGGGRRPRGIVATNAVSFPGGIISPTSLTESSQGNGVRCVCDDTSADEADGFMLQCESCEMWLHGRCINLTKRSMPRVYICRFCANTPNSSRRCRGSGLGIAGLLSPLANKSYRTFR